jgi:hypothetical protein
MTAWPSPPFDRRVGARSTSLRRSTRTRVALVAVVVGLLALPAAAMARPAVEPSHPQPTTHVHPSDEGLATASSHCWPSGTPAGALPSQPPPVFCSIVNHGPDTSASGANSWSDDFNHGLAFASFDGTAYRLFENLGFVNETLHWRHADHWMVDVAAPRGVPPRWVNGGAMMRPDRTFRFVDGKLVVEVDAAAGISTYGTNAWPEVIISAGGTPHGPMGGLYGYEKFPQHGTFGCRLQATRYPVCALKSNNGSVAQERISSRIYEISAFQPGGATNYGGSPHQGREQAWRVCRGDQDPDDLCRDRFRFEWTATTFTLYVNGSKYFEQTGLPSLPADLLHGDVYVYLASFVVSHQSEAVRFHWDRVTVNPTAPPPVPPTTTTTAPTTTTTAPPTTTTAPTTSTRPGGDTNVVVRARGTTGDERMVLTVSGQDVAAWTVGTQFADYAVTIPGQASINQVRVRFTNDLHQPPIDRDLEVDWVRVGSSTYQAEDPAVSSVGTWTGSGCSTGGHHRTQWLHCNGYFDFAGVSP